MGGTLLSASSSLGGRCLSTKSDWHNQQICLLWSGSRSLMVTSQIKTACF